MSLKPYYQDSAVTIYHGDCREILPLVAADVLVTDPPYGTGWFRGGGAVGEFQVRHETAAWDVWAPEWLELVNLPVAVFCPTQGVWDVASRISQPSVARYDKTNPAPLGAHSEPIVVSGPWPGPWAFSEYNGDNDFHPCQKPLRLLRALLVARGGEIVVDPFMGSGTTLRAAKDLGRKAIGIEIEERYCEIAARRCAQEVMDLSGAVGETGETPNGT